MPSNRKNRLWVIVSLGPFGVDVEGQDLMSVPVREEFELFELCIVCLCHDQKLKISCLSFSLWQNWSGMKCQFKLFRMAMALVCSKFLIIFRLIENMS